MRLINADAAIESLTEYGNGRAVYIGVEEAVRRIEQLPSVQLNHNAEASKMGIVHCEDCEHWDTSWETVYGLHYCPMIDMSTKKNFFCKYGAEKRGEIDETD